MFGGLWLAHRLSLKLLLRCFEDLVQNFSLYLPYFLLVGLLYDAVESPQRFSKLGEEVVFDAVVGSA